MSIAIVAGRYCSRKPAAASPTALAETWLAPALAADIRNRLQEVMNLLNAPDAADPDGVPVNVLIGFNSPATPTDG